MGAPFDFRMATRLHDGPHIAKVSHDAQVLERESLAGEPLIQRAPQPLGFLVRDLCCSGEGVLLHDGDVAQREDVLHRGFRGLGAVLCGSGSRDELGAEVVIDEKTAGLSVALDDPFLGGGRGWAWVPERGGGAWVCVDLVEGMLDEGVHHEA